MKASPEPQIALIAHNLRSCHNVGSLLRTAEGLAVDKIYLTGYTPYPSAENDSRLPHLSQKISRQITKTSLGAEKYINWEQSDNINDVIKQLKQKGFQIVALEQTTNSIELPKLRIRGRIALIVGREVEGIESKVIEKCDQTVEIPMLGKKESFNVVNASAMALYHLRHISS